MNPDPPPSTAAFPRTRVTLIGDLSSADEATRARAAETLAAVYWHPIHAHLRYRWRLGVEDAEDLTQDFLGHALARKVFARYDPAKARFRTFVRVCLDRFMQNTVRSEARLKRGGGVSVVALGVGDSGDAGGVIGDRGDSGRAPIDGSTTEAEYEARFHQEWVRGVFTHAVRGMEEDCRQRGKPVQFLLFEAYDLHDPGLHDSALPDSSLHDPAAGTRPTYAALAQAHDLPITQVTNHLAAARRRFREIALETLSALCASDAEYRAEARALLGIEVA